MPPLSTLKNIILVPLPAGSNQKNLRYELAPSFGTPFDHMRWRRGEITSSSVYYPLENTLPSHKVVGVSLYGGVLFGAFGHFIAESLHRLWPVFQEPSLANVPIVFHSTDPAIATGSALPEWMQQIFALIGISLDRLVIVNSPIEVEELLVAQQGSIIGRGPLSSDYSEIFPPVRARSNITRPRRGHVYISRSKYIHKGSYLGEMLVEQVLEETKQFRIVHPQEHPVSEVVDILESSESAVFAEGSAMHLLELCREPVPKGFVVLRRREFTWEQFYKGMMDLKVENLSVHPMRASLTSLGWSRRRESALGQNASTVQDIPNLLKAISQFCGVKLRTPSDMEVRQGYALSLASMMLDPQSTRGTFVGTGPAALLKQLQMQVLALDILPFDIPIPN